MNEHAAPEPNSHWRHRNGHLYTVMFITNTAKLSEKHPPDVVYKGSYGRMWSRPLSDWHRSMTKL